MASNRKFTFVHHNNNPNRTNQNFSNNNRPNNPTLNQNSANTANNQDNDEDFLDISDTELIRASQVVESQLKFTNNVHHKTSNALNIFSQFNNEVPHSQVPTVSQMQPPAMTIMGHPTSVVGSQFNTVDTYSQLETTRCELKEIKNANMQKEGEVKILRDKLKKQEQEMQRVRNEKLELLKKIQTQQIEAKKNLDKQMEFKELENQFKSQELMEMQMKCKQLEAKLKKSQNTVNPPLNSFPPPAKMSTATPATTAAEAQQNFQQQMNSQTIFDEEFSRKRGSSQNTPSTLLSSNKGHGVKRLAQNSTESLFQDEENENSGRELKRPSLGITNIDPKEKQQANPFNPQTTMRSHLSSITNTTAATPPLPASEMKRDATKTVKPSSVVTGNTTPVVHHQQGTATCPVTPSLPTKVQKAHVELKRTAQLNLKSSHAIKDSLNKKMAVLNVSDTLESLEDKHLASNKGPKSIDSNDTLKIKSRANEKIYKLIDLFAESASNLNKYNSTTTRLHDVHDEESTFLMNPNATNLNIHSLSKQLENLLEYMSYKSAASPISSDLFSSFITASLTESSISASSSANNSLLIIDRVEFVSNSLNSELVNVIKYCLNASFTVDGHVSSNVATTKNTKKLDEPRQLPSLLSFTSIQPGIIPSCNATENLKRLIHASKNKQTPASSQSIVDLVCYSYEVCVSLFLFLSSLLLINYSQNEINKRSYKLMKSKQLSKSHQPIIYEKLIKLKQEFFRLTNYVLKSINFSTSSIDFDASSATNHNDLLSSLSTSSTPYSTLKILNTVLDSLNHLIYLPVLNQQSDPNSIMTWFYFSLADNIHNIFRKKINLNQLIELNQETGTANEKSDAKMEEEIVDQDEPMVIEIDPKSDAQDFDDKFDEDDEPCLFQLFYQKLVKYFGDVVYTLEACEARQQNSIDENPAIIIANTVS